MDVGSRERQVIKEHHPLGRHSVPPFCTCLTHSRTNQERGKQERERETTTVEEEKSE